MERVVRITNSAHYILDRKVRITSKSLTNNIIGNPMITPGDGWPSEISAADVGPC